MSRKNSDRTASLKPVRSYDIDPCTGFVPSEDPLEILPNYYEAWERVVPIMAPLIRSGKVREALASMPHLDVEGLVSDVEQERAFLLLTMFANAWVWGGREPHLSLPAALSFPLCTLAAKLGRPPITHYGSMALRNWKRVERTQPFSADNVQVAVSFLGGVDEEWFFLASMAVELAGAPLLGTIHAATEASLHREDAELLTLIEKISVEMQPVSKALERMREWCDPYIFYHRVRRFVAGWPEPGVIYEGVWDKPRIYIGGSAGQSSLIQAVDSALGVNHDGAATGTFFKAMRAYMPTLHRQFVEDVGQISRIRQRCELGSTAMQTAYNHAVEQVARFRFAHQRLAHDYVTVPSGMQRNERGTGGTSLASFLKEARQETRRTAIGRP